MKAFKLCLTHIDDNDRFLKYCTHNDYLEVSCNYWDKYPFCLTIESETTRGYARCIKVSSSESHDHSLTREILYGEIDMISPVGPILYKQKRLELEMANLERIEIKDRNE